MRQAGSLSLLPKPPTHKPTSSLGPGLRACSDTNARRLWRSGPLHIQTLVEQNGNVLIATAIPPVASFHFAQGHPAAISRPVVVATAVCCRCFVLPVGAAGGLGRRCSPGMLPPIHASIIQLQGSSHRVYPARFRACPNRIRLVDRCFTASLQPPLRWGLRTSRLACGHMVLGIRRRATARCTGSRAEPRTARRSRDAAACTVSCRHGRRCSCPPAVKRRVDSTGSSRGHLDNRRVATSPTLPMGRRNDVPIQAACEASASSVR